MALSNLLPASICLHLLEAQWHILCPGWSFLIFQARVPEWCYCSDLPKKDLHPNEVYFPFCNCNCQNLNFQHDSKVWSTGAFQQNLEPTFDYYFQGSLLLLVYQKYSHNYFCFDTADATRPFIFDFSYQSRCWLPGSNPHFLILFLPPRDLSTKCVIGAVFRIHWISYH